MIFGALTVTGLIPQNAPVYVSDMKKANHPPPKTVNSPMLTDLIEATIAPAVREHYPGNNAVWQDDRATIHRTRLALETVERNFNSSRVL